MNVIRTYHFKSGTTVYYVSQMHAMRSGEHLLQVYMDWVFQIHHASSFSPPTTSLGGELAGMVYFILMGMQAFTGF